MLLLIGAACMVVGATTKNWTLMSWATVIGCVHLFFGGVGLL